MGIKKCSKCKVEKDRSDFGKSNQNKDGLKYNCKQCVKEYKQEYQEANKELISEKKKEYRKANKEQINEYQKEHYKANRERIIARQNDYKKARRKTDSLFRLKENLRITMLRCLTGIKSKRTEEILGMPYKALKERIGEYDTSMQLDHIIPLSWAKNEEEVYTLNHYSNFQLLTAEENMLKGNRFAKAENVRQVFKEHNNKLAIAKIILRNNHKINLVD